MGSVRSLAAWQRALVVRARVPGATVGAVVRKSSLILALVAGGLGASASVANAATHSPIQILSDADFTPVGASSGCKCVTSIDANGAYVIGNWSITSNGGAGVLVVGTTKPFRLDHISVHTSGNGPGIQLQSVSQASLAYPNISNPPSVSLVAGNVGIEIDNSSGVSVTGGSVNDLGDWGIRVSHSNKVTLNGVQVSHTGLINPNSESTPGLPYDDHNPWLGGLVGDAPGGILLIDSTNNLLSNVGATSDAYAGIELVRSNHNTLNGDKTTYPDYYGLVLQSSNDNTISNSAFVASDYDGVLLRNSSSNMLTNNRISANSPIGTEYPKQIVAYFAAGLYIGWQSADNRVQGNYGQNLAPAVEIDDDQVPPPSSSSAQGRLQTLNPLNDQGTGGDPGSSGWYQTLATLGAGTAWGAAIPNSPVAGTETQTDVCGNSFSGVASYTPGLNPNSPC